MSLALSRTLGALIVCHQSSEGFRLTSEPPLNLPFLWHFQMFPPVPCAVASLDCSPPPPPSTAHILAWDVCPCDSNHQLVVQELFRETELVE